MRVPAIVRLMAGAGVAGGFSASTNAQEAVGAAPPGSRTGLLEEVVVTATKREEKLRDVPMGVSALTGDQLQKMGAQSLSDYITTLPGVSFNDYQPGVSEVIIRGISGTTYHEQGQTVVGYYVNEIPLSEAGWPIVIPDVDTFDLERVEVLRGPQGTLFGAATLGGLVNYVAKTANASALDASAEAMVGHTRNSEETNYALKGMVNVPLITDKLALRVTGIDRFDAGYLDNIGLGIKSSNDLVTHGARMSLVFTPHEGTKLSWLTMSQQTNLADQTYVYLGTLNRRTVMKEPQFTSMLLNSLRLDQDVGVGTLTVLGAYTTKMGHLIFDSTDNLLLAQTPTDFRDKTKATARHFEARLASKEGGSISWLVGAAAYSSGKSIIDDTHQTGAAAFIDANPADYGGFAGALLAPDDVANRYRVAQSNQDYGVFGELQFKLNTQWTLAAGGRYFNTKSDTTVTRPPSASYPGVFDAVGSSFEQKQSETGFTPKITLTFRPQDGLMTYASYSTGFRVGGANPNPPGLTGVAETYGSDKLKNYEVGIRTDLFSRRVLLDLTAFHIDWSNIQVRLFTPAPFYYSYVTNAGAAKVDGVELSATWRVAPTFDFQTNTTWEHARVSEFLPDTFFAGGGHPAGTVLPGSAKWQIGATASWRPAGVPLSPRFEATYRFESQAPVAWGAVNTRGGFPITDVRAAFTISRNLNVSLFVDNVADKMGTLNAPFADFYVIPLGTVTKPRSFGLRADWNL